MNSIKLLKNHIIGNDNETLLIDEDSPSELDINIDKEISALSVFLEHNKDQEKLTINININAKSNQIKLLLINNIKLNTSATINVNINNKCIVNMFHLNISVNDSHEIINMNLNNLKAQIYYHLASLSLLEYQKHQYLNVNHYSPQTLSDIKAYAIAKDSSLQEIKCISNIVKGMKKSEAHQELRLLVFDKSSKALSDPILLIDENDIMASHANAVGMLDPNQMFYLQSRGLTVIQARKLICMGYFKNVIDAIDDEQMQNEIVKQIEQRIERSAGRL